MHRPLAAEACSLHVPPVHSVPAALPPSAAAAGLPLPLAPAPLPPPPLPPAVVPAAPPPPCKPSAQLPLLRSPCLSLLMRPHDQSEPHTAHFPSSLQSQPLVLPLMQHRPPGAVSDERPFAREPTAPPPPPAVVPAAPLPPCKPSARLPLLRSPCRRGLSFTPWGSS